MKSLIAARPHYQLPNEGLHPAKIFEVEQVDDEFGGDRIRWAFDLEDETQENGYPKRVFRTCSFKFTAQSALTGIVTSILGRSLTDTECAGFDLRQLIGRRVQLVIKHQVSERSGQPYAKVDSIVHVPDGSADEAPGMDDTPDAQAEEGAAQDGLPFS